jgi:hypothetical protein
VDTVPDLLLLRKFGSAGNRTRNLWYKFYFHVPYRNRGLALCDYYELSPRRISDAGFERLNSEILCAPIRIDELTLKF